MLMPPYHDDLAIRGGVFGVANGYERAEWFDNELPGKGRGGGAHVNPPVPKKKKKQYLSFHHSDVCANLINSLY